MVASSFASDRKSSATARKSKTRCSRGKPTPPPVCPHLAAPAVPVPSSFTSLLGCHPEKHPHSPRLDARLSLLTCVCLCFSDCESREVLTLLCQGETLTDVSYHCPTHCGHSLVLFHTLSSSFSCDLRSFSVVLLCASCLVSPSSPQTAAGVVLLPTASSAVLMPGRAAGLGRSASSTTESTSAAGPSSPAAGSSRRPTVSQSKPGKTHEMLNVTAVCTGARTGLLLLC